MNLDCCVVASSGQLDIVADLPRVEVFKSPYGDTLGDVRSCEDQTLVVSIQALVDPLDDETNSSCKNDLCSSSASLYNLNKVLLPIDKSTHTLVGPCKNQGESTLVYGLPTTSKVVQNDQLGENDLDLFEDIGNPNCDCTCENGFGRNPLVARDGVKLRAGYPFEIENYPLEKERVACLEMLFTLSSCVFYVEHTNDDELEISKYLHEDTLVGVDLCDIFLYPLCAYDIFHSDLEGMTNFEDDIFHSDIEDHNKFLPLVRKYWANKMCRDNKKGVWMNLKALKPHLKQLNNNNFRGVTEKIACIKIELMDTQARMVTQYKDSLAGNEKNLLQQLEKWSLIEESIHQQKSRATWIKLGDANTKYFTTVMKERRHNRLLP
ncbi:hypothetical protein FXO37_07080 [Capsicum annuum]|nr:hypothetical protein FXO37_07080 [Capsicum annuum]